MKPRARLFEDPSIAADVRADLELVSRYPFVPDLERAAQSLAEALAADAPPPDAAKPSATQAPSPPSVIGAASAGGGLRELASLKLVVPVAIGVAVVGAGLWRLELESQPRARPAPSHSSPAAGAANAELPSAAREETGHSPMPSSGAAQAAHDGHATSSLSKPVDEPSAASREIAQLQRIQALLDIDPAGAYRLARASQREFPAGALAEEREGLTVLAAFGMGERERARALARRFLARHPESPLRARIEAIVVNERAR